MSSVQFGAGHSLPVAPTGYCLTVDSCLFDSYIEAIESSAESTFQHCLPRQECPRKGVLLAVNQPVHYAEYLSSTI